MPGIESMQKVVVDSDIIIDHLRGHSQNVNNLLKGINLEKLQVFIPGIVVSEIFSGQDTKQGKRLKVIDDLFFFLNFTPADEQISRLAGMIVRDNRPMQLNDAIVAATAISLNAKLATRNKKHFAGVKDLRFYRYS